MIMGRKSSSFKKKTYLLTLFLLVYLFFSPTKWNKNMRSKTEPSRNFPWGLGSKGGVAVDGLSNPVVFMALNPRCRSDATSTGNNHFCWSTRTTSMSLHLNPQVILGGQKHENHIWHLQYKCSQVSVCYKKTGATINSSNIMTIQDHFLRWSTQKILWSYLRDDPLTLIFQIIPPENVFGWSVFGGPNTFSPGVWKDRVMDVNPKMPTRQWISHGCWAATHQNDSNL